jgi:hypothetical protein
MKKMGKKLFSSIFEDHIFNIITSNQKILS